MPSNPRSSSAGTDGLRRALRRAVPRPGAQPALSPAHAAQPGLPGRSGRGPRTAAPRPRRAQRVATTDVIHPLSDLAGERAWRIGLYGGADGVAERAAASLRELHPEVQIVATWSGFGTPPSIGELRAAKLDVLMVGLGAGKQEHYAHTVAAPAGVPAILTCGGLFDFLSGDARRAPMWMQSAGLEWAFRVLREPRRFFVRYLLGNTFFLTAARAERFVHAPAPGAPRTTLGERDEARRLRPAPGHGARRRFGRGAGLRPGGQRAPGSRSPARPTSCRPRCRPRSRPSIDDGAVYGIAESSTTMVIGGTFTSVNGASHPYLLAFDAMTGRHRQRLPAHPRRLRQHRRRRADRGHRLRRRRLQARERRRHAVPRAA